MFPPNWYQAFVENGDGETAIDNETVLADAAPPEGMELNDLMAAAITPEGKVRMAMA